MVGLESARRNSFIGFSIITSWCFSKFNWLENLEKDSWWQKSNRRRVKTRKLKIGKVKLIDWGWIIGSKRTSEKRRR